MLTSTHSYLSDDKALEPKEGESIDDVDAEYSCSRKRRSSCLQTESSEHEPSIPYDRLSALVSAIEDVDSNTVLDNTDDAEIFSTASLSSSTGPNVKLPSLASLCASIQAPTAAMTEEFNQKVADSMKENSNDSQHVQPNGFMSWYMNSMSRYKNYMAAYAAYYQAYKYALACQAQNSNVKAPKSPIFPQSREDKSTIQEEKRRRLGSKAGDHSNLCPIKPNIFPPSTIRPAEEPIFTGRYGHDDLLKAYMRPKSASKAFNQQSFATSEIMNRLGNDPKPSDNLASKYYHNSSTTLPSNPVKESRSGDLSKDSEMDDDSRDEDSDQEHSSPQPSFDRPKKYNYEKEMSEHRSAHTLAERRRRKEMKKLFDQLKVLLPGYSNLDRQRLSKWDILSGTVEVIDELSERRSALLAKKQYLVSLLSKSSESVDPSTVSNS